MNTDQQRVNNLVDYVQGLMNKENGKELYLKYKDDIEKVTPQEVFEIFHRQLKKGIEAREILLFLDKVINVFYKSLSQYKWERPAKGSFLDYLMQENAALTSRLEEIKVIIKQKDLKANREELLKRINELSAFNDHYLKKENILFPYLEKKMEKFEGLAIMWALHDETRFRLKRVISYLEAEDCDEAELNAALGDLFFAMYGLVQKEELILFPAATEIIDEKGWAEMLRQSFEYGFPFIEKPKQEPDSLATAESDSKLTIDSKEGYCIKTETGVLDLEHVLMIFNALPVDLTFVDENNKVKFFTKPKDRIFPRSPAAIGRDVKNCHPPQSVHVVNEIIDSFKAGEQDSAKFWIKLRDKMILIQYFALRDSQGTYKGVLEVSQDITEIRELEGERRLLHWGK